MERIIIHWTAGGNRANATDKKHYHVLIEGDGDIVSGDHPIKANKAPLSKEYAAHTLNCNTNSIGVSMCGMAGAVESPFSPGKSPITEVQFRAMIKEVAKLSRQYGIGVSPKTILTHAEVESNLGIKQRGKWDITVLPWDQKVKGAKAVGDIIRKEVSALTLPVSPELPPEVKSQPSKPAPGEKAATNVLSALITAAVVVGVIVFVIIKGNMS